MALARSTRQQLVTQARPLAGHLAVTTKTVRDSWIALACVLGYMTLIIMLLALLSPSLSTLGLGGLVTSGVGSAVIGGAVPAALANSYLVEVLLNYLGAIYGLMFGSFLAFLAAGVISGPRETGLLELVLARAITRRRLFLERSLAYLFMALAMVLASLLLLWLGSVLQSAAALDWKWVWLAHLDALAILIFYGGMGMMAGAWVRSSRAGGSLGLGVSVLLYFIVTVATLSSALGWLRWLSPITYAPFADILLQHDFVAWKPVVLVVAGLLLVLVALVRFERQDM